MRTRRRNKKYSHEFKVEAVRLVGSSERPIAQLAQELGVPSTTLEGWLQKFGPPREKPAVIDPPSPSSPTSSESEELTRLRRENERLRMERDFLKKAAAFFANESK